jgi:hypothetical protein
MRDTSEASIVPQIGEPCAVCLEVLPQDPDKTQKTGCSHVFHKECLATWLDKHNTCPTCRQITHESTEKPDVESGETRINHDVAINDDGVCVAKALICSTLTVVFVGITFLLWDFCKA